MQKNCLMNKMNARKFEECNVNVYKLWLELSISAPWTISKKKVKIKQIKCEVARYHVIVAKIYGFSSIIDYFELPRHLLSNTTKTDIESVIPWFNSVKCRRGNSCILIGRHSPDRIDLFQFKIHIYFIEMKKSVHFLFKISNGTISFDFFFLVFDEKFLKVPFRLQFV